MALFFLVAESLLSGCSTVQKTLPPKQPIPEKKAPELGVQPSPQVSFDHSSGIVYDLKHKAMGQMKAGEPEQAFSTLEQALRINPNDPVIWTMLAEIQLERGNVDQAEQLARKSNLLAKNDRALHRRNWHIIAQALEKRGLSKEAAAAKRRADK